jgi:serine phosphatase RsbU (regulator of sigma subunit)
MRSAAAREGARWATESGESLREDTVRRVLDATVRVAPREAFEEYVWSISHQWSRTLTALGFTLIPLFLVLDYYTMPVELLTRFALYRATTTIVVIAQYAVLRATKPSRYSIAHGYFFSFVVGSMIALMTTDLSGLNSTYYAGLNLVMIATNLLLPWRAIHSAFNGLLVIGLYVVLNLLIPNHERVHYDVVVNNMYFLISTAIITVAISWVKQRLIREEFFARSNLETARDALWGEMEVAKHIQTSLLPKERAVDSYDVAAETIPAAEVGGDYYDVIARRDGELWVAIGDVSGHGVESGLIMMMAQTSLATAVERIGDGGPSDVVRTVNGVLTENIARLGADRYMTLTALVFRDGEVVFAGKHQDILVYRAATGRVESIPTMGTWLGVLADLSGHVSDARVRVDVGDVVLLFTDGVTEATSAAGEMFGEERLEAALSRHAGRPAAEITEEILEEVRQFVGVQADDITVLALKRTSTRSSDASPGKRSRRTTWSKA